MSRHPLRSARVLETASSLLSTKTLKQTPPWYETIALNPPSQILVRPSMIQTPLPQRRVRKNKKPSRMYQPLPVHYEEDKLRAEFFGDHPWELARPKVVLEDGGANAGEWDWSTGLKQPGKRIDGESVVQRQLYLMHHHNLPKATAYDIARKEFYKLRHFEDVERRIAQEEALAVGAYFGPGPLQIGIELENKMWEDWKVWAENEVELLKQQRQSAYTSVPGEATDEEGAMEDSIDPLTELEEQQAVQELGDKAPGSERGQEAYGGSLFHPSQGQTRV